MRSANLHESVPSQGDELDPSEYVAATLRGEHIVVPVHLRDDKTFRDGVETELVTLLNKQLLDESLLVAQEIPRSMVLDDKVHSAAVRELVHLEQHPAENFHRIVQLVVTFRMRIDELDLPQVLKDKIRPFLPPEKEEFKQAA